MNERKSRYDSTSEAKIVQLSEANEVLGAFKFDIATSKERKVK